MLLIDRPPQRESDRLRTSLAVATFIAGLACGRGAGGLCTTTGDGSARDAIWGVGGLGRGVNGTGARPVSIVRVALDFTTGDILAGSLGVTSSAGGELKMVDGGLKMAALAVPATTKKARANATRFMGRTPSHSSINGAPEVPLRVRVKVGTVPDFRGSLRPRLNERVQAGPAPHSSFGQATQLAEPRRFGRR